MSHPTPIDIANNPELVRIAEEVEATKKPHELKRENKTVAMIVPAAKAASKKKQGKMKPDYKTFRSAAGGWQDVDTDKLLADIYADRRRESDQTLTP